MQLERAGYLIRLAYLQRWAKRLEIHLASGKNHAPPQLGLLDQTHKWLESARTDFDHIHKLVNRESFHFGLARQFLVSANYSLRQVAFRALPCLTVPEINVRKFEEVLAKQFQEIGISGVLPVVYPHYINHLAVSTRAKSSPILYVSAAGCYLHLLSLVYHEIGHWFIGHHVDIPRLEKKLKLSQLRMQQMNEILADLFAALVAGETYLASLAMMLLSQPNLSASRQYPEARLRLEVALSALHEVDKVRKTNPSVVALLKCIPETDLPKSVMAALPTIRRYLEPCMNAAGVSVLQGTDSGLPIYNTLTQAMIQRRDNVDQAALWGWCHEQEITLELLA